MATNVPDKIPSAYRSKKLEAAYRRGWSSGHGEACQCVPKVGHRIDMEVDYVGLGRFVTEDNIREYHELVAHHAASPGQESSDAEAGAFSEGQTAAIHADLKDYTNEDYGLPPESPEPAKLPKARRKAAAPAP